VGADEVGSEVGVVSVGDGVVDSLGVGLEGGAVVGWELDTMGEGW
jgi:hypothetical protein